MENITVEGVPGTGGLRPGETDRLRIVGHRGQSEWQPPRRRARSAGGARLRSRPRGDAQAGARGRRGLKAWRGDAQNGAKGAGEGCTEACCRRVWGRGGGRGLCTTMRRGWIVTQSRVIDS